MRILLVEDDRTARLALARLLETSGHEVAQADSVRLAAELIGSGAHDLLVSDLSLPDGDGRDVLAAWRRRGPEPTVMLSGWGDEAGFDYSLTKPLQFQRLLAVIARHEAA